MKNDDLDSCLAVSMGSAAALLGVSRSLAYRLAAEGALPSVRIGGRRVVPRAALALWLDAEVQRQAGRQPGEGG